MPRWCRSQQVPGLKVRTAVKAGGIDIQHNRRPLTVRRLRAALASVLRTYADPVRRAVSGC